MSYEDFNLYPISYSKLSKFETCPKQWEGQYIEKCIAFVDSPATRWGSDVHDALDSRFKNKEPLSERFASYEKYAKSLERIAEGAALCSEYELVIDKNGNRVSWGDPTAYLRGRTDVSIFYPDGRCIIYDHKTGSRRTSDELEFFAMLTFVLHPEVERIKTIYAWYKEVVGDSCKMDVQIYDRSQYPVMREKFDKKIAKIESALEFGLFPKRPSGLCKNFCGSESCELSGAFVK